MLWLGLGQLYQVTGETDKLHEIERRATTLHPQNRQGLGVGGSSPGAGEELGRGRG